jgi:FtsH-binding integral membrane protein
MLSMSLSVAAAGTLLATFMETHEKLRSFHLTFFCMGATTVTSTWIFAQLNPEIKAVDESQLKSPEVEG